MKLTSLFLFTLINVSILSGQEGLRLGVNLDPMASWFSPKTNQIDRDGTRPGISGGLMVEYYFHPNYGITTGLNIGTMGGSLAYDEAVTINTGDNNSVPLPAGSTVVFNTSYISLPIGLKLKTNEIGYFTYFAQLGFNQQINIGSRASSTGNNLNKDNVPKETNLLNMSYYFGAGVEYNVGGQTSLVAGLLFHNGFVDVLSNNDHKAVLNYLTIRVGVLF